MINRRAKREVRFVRRQLYATLSMRVLLYCNCEDRSSASLYTHIEAYLKVMAISATFTNSLKEVNFGNYDLLISHGPVPSAVRTEIECIAGRQISRPEGLAIIHASGFPTMTWSTAGSKKEVLDLFDKWGVDRLIFKKSYTANSEGLLIINRDNVEGLTWKPDVDIFCKDVNTSNTDDLYKAEVFAGNLIVSWMRSVPRQPVSSYPAKLPPVPSTARSLYTYTDAESACIKRCSKQLVDNGFGYCSLDMMRSDTGELVAIEVNTFAVATWWSSQLGATKERYAQAVYDFVQKRTSGGGTSSPAHPVDRG
jgi:hypothetical protein